MMSGLWGSFGPAVMAQGVALVRQTATAAQTSAAQAQARAATLNAARKNGGEPSSMGHARQQSISDRRRQLEAELAALPPDSPHVNIPQTVPAYGSSRASSSSDIGGNLRERAASASRFEEIEVPSDAEGYDVRDSDDDGMRPAAGRRTSSFFGGWGIGGGSAKSGYERVKSE